MPPDARIVIDPDARPFAGDVRVWDHDGDVDREAAGDDLDLHHRPAAARRRAVAIAPERSIVRVTPE